MSSYLSLRTQDTVLRYCQVCSADVILLSVHAGTHVPIYTHTILHQPQHSNRNTVKKRTVHNCQHLQL